VMFDPREPKQEPGFFLDSSSKRKNAMSDTTNQHSDPKHQKIDIQK